MFPVAQIPVLVKPWTPQWRKTSANFKLGDGYILEHIYCIFHHGCMALLLLDKNLPASKKEKKKKSPKTMAFHTKPLYATVVTDT